MKLTTFMVSPFRYADEGVGSVQFNEGLAQPIDGRPSVYFQVIDAYGFQRELQINWNREVKQFDVHAYIHPGIRNIQTLTEKKGLEVIDKLRDLALNNPARIFGPDHNKQVAGHFMRMHTMLFSPRTNAVESLKML